MRNRGIRAVLYLCAIIAIALTASIAHAATFYQYEKTVSAQSWIFSAPQGVAVDGSGNVYVLNESAHRVQKFDPSGTQLTTWGSYGTGDGMFIFPYGIGVDGSGNVYVADSSNHRIQKFDSNGTFITKWGAEGSGDGQFEYPSGVAVDGSGNVYVADCNNHRIQKFDSSGAYITQWGSEGSDNGQFEFTIAIAVSGAGNVYVVDMDNNRIQEFDSNGTYITQWGSEGSDDGQFSMPYAIAVDGDGNVYVVDATNRRIQKFDSGGTFIAKWGSIGTGNEQFVGPRGVAVSGAGNVYVADPFANRVQTFTPDGTFVSLWGSTGDGQLHSPRGATVDGSGNLYMVDPGNNRIQKFGPSGTYITQWGSWDNGDGHFQNPFGVASDGAGYLYVADTNNQRIQKFDTSGTFITKWGSLGSGDGLVNFPQGVAADGSGNVYVADTSNHRIQKFNASGTFAAKWGSRGTGDGLFNAPSGIAVDGPGNVYVADSGNNRIQRFDTSGTFIAKWGTLGSGDGQFNYPTSVAVDGTGNVYVADRSNHRIQKFDPSGTFITKWGSVGSGNAQFNSPFAVAIDSSSGNVYVADTNNNRVQEFVLAEDTAPAGTVSINSGAAFTNSTTVTLGLSATDELGVTGYYISNSSAAPLANAAGWTPVTPAMSFINGVGHTLDSGNGTKTVYVWYKNSSALVSDVASSTIVLDPAGHPAGGVAINNSAAYTNNKTVSLHLSASDDVAFAAYYISTKATAPGKKTKWIAVGAPSVTIDNAVAFNLAGKTGVNSVYAWYKDITGIISNSATDSIIYDKTLPKDGKVIATPGDSQVQLDWSGFSDAGSGIAGYKVAYVAGKKAPKSCPAALPTTTDISNTVTSLTNNTPYSFRVCAVDGAGNISKGATKSATPIAPGGGGAIHVSGTAAMGAAISGATVTLVDSTGASISGSTGQGGSFSLDATGLTPPFLLSITSGDVTLYSVSADLNSSTTINLTPLTDLIVSTWYGVQGTSAAAAFSNPLGNPPPTPTEIKVIGTVVQNMMSSALQAAGVDNAAGFNPISTPFAANGSGIDGVLDDTTVTFGSGAGAESFNTPGGIGSTTYLIVNTPGGIVNSTITTFSSGIVNTSTTQTTGDGTTSPMSGSTSLPTTPDQSSALALINTTISSLIGTINTRGNSLTIADLSPYADPAYMDNGRNATQWETGVVNDLKGGTISFTGLQINSLGSSIADVSFQIAMSRGGQSGTESVETRFRLIGGSWLISGNGRSAAAYVTTWAWDHASYGFSNNVRFEVDDPQATVTSVAISGPGVTDGVAVPMVCDSGHLNGLPSCGNAYGDDSQRAFQADFSFWPTIGSQYTFSLATSGGPVQYSSTVIAAYGFEADGTPVMADFPAMSGAVISSPPTISQLMAGTTVTGSVYVPIWVKGNPSAPHFNYEGPGGANNDATTAVIDGSWVSDSAIAGQVNSFTITIPAATSHGTVGCGGNTCYNITFQGQTGDVEGGWVGMDACFQDQSSCTNSGVEIH